MCLGGRARTRWWRAGWAAVLRSRRGHFHFTTNRFTGGSLSRLSSRTKASSSSPVAKVIRPSQSWTGTPLPLAGSMGFVEVRLGAIVSDPACDGCLSSEVRAIWFSEGVFTVWLFLFVFGLSRCSALALSTLAESDRPLGRV